MIEREFIAQKTKEYYIHKYIEAKLENVGISAIRLKKIPLGEKIIIDTNRPSLIVGSKGSNIKALTKELKSKFKLENPQIEIVEVKNIFLNANLVAERISSSLERFGSARFKGVGHKTLENVIRSGAIGVEIIISGKVPSSRAKSWRFYKGYLKKCGDIAVSGVKKAQTIALLKSGVLGIKVAIMTPDIVLPDYVEILEEPEQIIEEINIEKKKSNKKSVKKTPKKTKSTKKEKKAKKVIIAEKEVKEVPASVNNSAEEIKKEELKKTENKEVVNVEKENNTQ